MNKNKNLICKYNTIKIGKLPEIFIIKLKNIYLDIC